MTRVAAVQVAPRPLDPEWNLALVIERIHAAASLGAQVAVFPECVLSGYMLSAQEARSVAQPADGPHTGALAEACAEAGLQAAVVGTLEAVPGDRIYNTALVVGPGGLISRYRKTHLPHLGVDRFLAPGERLEPPLQLPVGRVGVLICYDLRLPEPARVLALGGAQVILVSTAWPASAQLYPEFVAQTRAAENGLYLVAANRCDEERGTRFLGASLICGPNGECLALAGEEETILCVDLDLDRSDDKARIQIPGEYELHLFKDRRPELYAQLASGEL
jgi:predicted amidohydrolase